MTDQDIDDLASEVMDGSDPHVEAWHRVAASCAQGARDEKDELIRGLHREAEACALLKTVCLTHPHLSTADLLRVTVNIAERAA